MKYKIGTCILTKESIWSSYFPDTKISIKEERILFWLKESMSCYTSVSVFKMLLSKHTYSVFQAVMTASCEKNKNIRKLTSKTTHVAILLFFHKIAISYKETTCLFPQQRFVSTCQSDLRNVRRIFGHVLKHLHQTFVYILPTVFYLLQTPH